MKTKMYLLFALLISAVVTYAADPKVTDIFTLDHHMSSHCEKKIKENLRFEKGVSNIEVSLKKNTITITYNPTKTNREKLIKAFKKIGFNAEFVGDRVDQVGVEEVDGCCKGAPAGDNSQCCKGEVNGKNPPLVKKEPVPVREKEAPGSCCQGK